jgi:hypothetical protein
MSRRKIVADYHGQQLELFPIGIPDIALGRRVADKVDLCHDRQNRFYWVTCRQRLFREEPLRFTVRRLPRKLGVLTAQNRVRLSAEIAAAFGREGY